MFIYFAVKKEYKKHFISQAIILGTTLTIVVIFEIGIRISGGFLEYSKYSNISFDFMLVFLSVHILIAIAAVGCAATTMVTGAEIVTALLLSVAFAVKV